MAPLLLYSPSTHLLELLPQTQPVRVRTPVLPWRQTAVFMAPLLSVAQKGTELHFDSRPTATLRFLQTSSAQMVTSRELRSLSDQTAIYTERRLMEEFMGTKGPFSGSRPMVC